MGAHVLDLELQLLLCPPLGALDRGGQRGGSGAEVRGVRGRTLKARCSRKCAVPFVSSVSAREPASIHTPTVEVWA